MIRCCYQCPEREIGCHSTCEKYKAEKVAWDKEKAAERKRKREEYCRMQEIAKAKARMAKGRRK